MELKRRSVSVREDLDFAYGDFTINAASNRILHDMTCILCISFLSFYAAYDVTAGV